MRDKSTPPAAAGNGARATQGGGREAAAATQAEAEAEAEAEAAEDEAHGTATAINRQHAKSRRTAIAQRDEERKQITEPYERER
jgi:hypothetical protein